MNSYFCVSRFWRRKDADMQHCLVRSLNLFSFLSIVFFRKSLLKAEGVRFIDPAEAIENKFIRQYRNQCGCSCTQQCLPGSTVQYSTVEYSRVQYSRVQCSTVQYSTVQYSTVQYSTVQYSTVQYSIVKYSTVQYLHCIIFSIFLLFPSSLKKLPK